MEIKQFLIESIFLKLVNSHFYLKLYNSWWNFPSLPWTPNHYALNQTSLQIFSKLFHHFSPSNFRDVFLKFSNKLDCLQELFSCTWQILLLFQRIPLHLNKYIYKQDSQNGILRNLPPLRLRIFIGSCFVVILRPYVLRYTSQFFQFQYSCHFFLLT